MSKEMVTVSRHTLLVYLGSIDGDWVEAGNDLRDALAVPGRSDLETLIKNNARYQWVQQHCDIDYRGHRPGGDYVSTDESIDAAMLNRDGATPSTDNVNVSRHEER
ncbi:hypothetical protein HBO37_28225 [Pseudomonas proteolytica]|uniref:hypothetical protein n=1 Tax=Pseudomonas proteolytica TaxID=219574 RepID=UPI00147601E4|nr:hypothetical protein [Pseudomonas proteolytica]NMZ09228.1 hypothetical protein [Pseudomonas proteolytica]